jgi:hypothetical protein
MAEQNTLLVSPDGKREWTPEDATQATNLRAKGWAPKADKSAPKTTTK